MARWCDDHSESNVCKSRRTGRQYSRERWSLVRPWELNTNINKQEYIAIFMKVWDLLCGGNKFHGFGRSKSNRGDFLRVDF